jgi:hypothetical protein
MVSSLCLSMISAQTLRVCREGKPVPTFPDHALAPATNAFDPMIESEVLGGALLLRRNVDRFGRNGRRASFRRAMMRPG